ncbi:hypothetical protein [uncultured Paludibaculum sp.]|uniref:hypothetical protein n=1 Tax=uncultured Paludibaculum sp. TaxID=1765020 RepID=UPI002AABB4C2|nr:hypothetical protein [uncultured Paludibaculum sp.]
MTSRRPLLWLMAQLILQGQDGRWLPLTVYSDRPVALQRADIRVRCGDADVPGARLKPGGGAVSVGIVFQGSKALLDNTGDAQAALRQFLHSAQRGDEFFTVNSVDAPVLGVGFTAEVNTLVSSISLPPGKRQAHLLDGMAFALQYLGHARNTNRALLVIYANDDAASAIKPGELAARLFSARVPVYVVSLCPRPGEARQALFPDLQKLAKDSGGDAWGVSSFAKLSDTLARVDVRPQYRLELPFTAHAACAEAKRLSIDWVSGADHGGINLRYQRQWPNGFGLGGWQSRR